MPIRPAREADLGLLLELIMELARYERAADQVHLDHDQLAAALFAEHPAVFAVIAETGAGEPVGFALYFLNFSTWEGVHGIYLEDLYVRPEARGQGFGSALMQHLARLAVDRGYARFEWWVLNWNTPAIEVYTALGARPMSEWTPYRLTGPALLALADRTAPVGDAESDA